ncbi:MAG: hypothetical protein ACXVCY_06895 [Pseudobdellovibrionaceae bacterium]
MKKVSDLMTGLGFNENAPDSSKEAFLKHLVKSTNPASFKLEVEAKKIHSHSKIEIQKLPEQLCFDFIKEEAVENQSQKKAVS